MDNNKMACHNFIHYKLTSCLTSVMFHFFVAVEPYIYVYLVLIITSFICMCRFKA